MAPTTKAAPCSLRCAARVFLFAFAISQPAQGQDQSQETGRQGAGRPAANLTEGVVAATAGTPGHQTGSRSRSCRKSSAENWIEQRFSDTTTVSGALTGRTEIEAPAWIRDGSASGVKYGFTVSSGTKPNDPAVAFTDVWITDLRSFDRFGAGIWTDRDGREIELFLSNVYIEPNWPRWDSYQTTNYDGIVLDGAKSIYAQSLTINNWNADSAIDNKAKISQFVDLHVMGTGHRPIRYWRPGPHYLVDSVIEKPGGGTLVWFKNCNATSLFVFRSTFNGAPRLTPDMVQCREGEAPNIVYLTEDPTQTGQMHPMFRSCAK